MCDVLKSMILLAKLIITLPVETTENVMLHFEKLLKDLFQRFYLNQRKSDTEKFHLLLSTSKKVRRSRPEVFCKKGVLKNFTKFTGKHLRQSLFFNKVAGQACQVFFCEFCNIFKNTFFHRTPLVAAC